MVNNSWAQGFWISEAVFEGIPAVACAVGFWAAAADVSDPLLSHYTISHNGTTSNSNATNGRGF